MSKTTDTPPALKVVDLVNTKTKRERQEFLDKTFFIALDMALKQDDWGTGEGEERKPINSIADRVGLALNITKEAYKRRLLAQ